MKEKVVKLDSGVIETRIYDNKGKLVEIRRKQPQADSYKPADIFRRSYNPRSD